MPNCESCGGCGHCSGCSTLELTAGEIRVLQLLGQIPFLPIARKADAEEPVCRELDDPQTGLILLCLEKRGLISLDYDAPLGGFDYAGYEGYPVRGSFALTARGQRAVELMDVMGLQ